MNRLLIVGVISMISLVTIGITSQSVSAAMTLADDEKIIAEGTQIVSPRKVESDLSFISQIEFERKAPIATSGNNIYIVWPTNRTGNDEVQFRSSIDGGTTFADKINLSNSIGAESQDVEIAADGDNVIVTWWERNQTAEEPVARTSSDNGATFGPLLRLASNGTIGTES
jgi:hypothetical protein